MHKGNKVQLFIFDRSMAGRNLLRVVEDRVGIEGNSFLELERKKQKEKTEEEFIIKCDKMYFNIIIPGALEKPKPLWYQQIDVLTLL